jgi:aminoglycoside phosphotransferase (APT) family kinase protein
VAARLLAETRLLPRLAPLLALAVPVPEVMVVDPLWVRHVLVPGTASEPAHLTAADGEAVGAFLRTLHDLPASLWASTGVPTAEAARQDLLAVLERMRRRVLPLLPVDRRATGARLLDASAERQPATLIHGDLGPAHLLVTAGRVTGVIDWSDAAEGDPAVDLAWVFHGAPPAFAEGVAAAYGPTAGERERARRRHRLGPWFEVLWGLEDGGPAYVASGLDGVLARLGP